MDRAQGAMRAAFLVALLLQLSPAAGAGTESSQPLPPKTSLPSSGMELERPTRAGTFYDVAGRRAAVFGYEHRAAEAWVYPLKILDDFQLAFEIEGYPLEFRGADTVVRINVRPEATTFTYSHAAFTVRQIVFAPIEEPGVVMLLDVESALPLRVHVSFRPRLKLSWPAGLMTGNLSWDEKARAFFITEESNRYVGVVGSPLARDVSVMPYQEEPRDVPARFVLEVAPETAKNNLVPIVIAGGIEGRERAKVVYEKLLGSAQSLYENNVAHYRQLQSETLNVETPDARLNDAFRWAKVGVDKGVVTNPLLGTGLVAGYRTSGDSERPGFAWFFGRDALWTAFALNSYGGFRTTRHALEFLKKFQRADGKIPHEISQSASLIPWFTDYLFPWASADAAPLYIIAHADLWRATGDHQFLQDNWESILKAYRFTEATDTDANGLIENTKFGHGWVEGGALYPAHEEIYLQGLWIAASRDLAEMAGALNDAALKIRASQNAERTRAATEQTYWLPERGYYAFATKLPATEPEKAAPGPHRERRQARMNELAGAKLFDEDTVLPAVPLWFGALADERAQLELDHLGSSQIATDWGARLISNQSRLYDPLSYHHGSVWPLFTGWVSMAAYRYGRPHVGYQALMANALLTEQSALGNVTELLSGDFNAPFGRSSHHQIWSEAMVVTPLVRGLLGIETTAGGTELRIAPQLPANWYTLRVTNIPAADVRYQMMLLRGTNFTNISLGQQATDLSGKIKQSEKIKRLVLAPSFPLDARITSVSVQGSPAKFSVTRVGDVQRVEIVIERFLRENLVEIKHEGGTNVALKPETPLTGATSKGLRLLRVRPDADGLMILSEGRGRASYGLDFISDRRFADDAAMRLYYPRSIREPKLSLSFIGRPDEYVRRESRSPFLK